MTADLASSTKSLKELRDYVLLLSLGKPHLCEEAFLQTFARNVASCLDGLQKGLGDPQSKETDQSEGGVQTAEAVEQIRSTVGKLLAADQAAIEACRSGEIDRQLESAVETLASTVKEGTAGEKGSPRDQSALNRYSPLLPWAAPLFRGLTFVAKAAAVVVIVGVLAFSWLYFTMEKTGSLEKKIMGDESTLLSLQEDMAKWEKDKKTLDDMIESRWSEDMGREKKIEIMDLRLQERELDEKIQGLRMDALILQRNLEEERLRLETLKEKPLLDRLLRR